MALMTSAEFQGRLTPYESTVKSTALAHRFMVRRSLAKFHEAVTADSQAQQATSRAPGRTPQAPPAAPRFHP